MVPYYVSPHGTRIPGILYGTAWKKGRTAQMVGQALALGFRGLDTACQPKHYNEPGVGAGVAARLGPGLAREDLYLQTKFTPINGQDPKRVPYDPNAPLVSQIAESCKLSLSNLQTTYLDALVLHSPFSTLNQTLTAWQAMEALVDQGLVRELGISNCYDLAELKAIWQAARIKPLVVQNRFYATTHFDTGIRRFCRNHGLFYQSFWTLTANNYLLEHPSIKELSYSYGVSEPQLFFRALTQLGIVPLTGTSSERHMREALSIFEFSLRQEEVHAVEKLFAR